MAQKAPFDSSTLTLPAALALWWPGCGGGGATATKAQAALKIHVAFDLCRRTLRELLSDGRTQDRRTTLQTTPLPRGALRLTSLGFFDLGVFAVIQRCLAAGCRLNRRKTKPNTYQLLLDPALQAVG